MRLKLFLASLCLLVLAGCGGSGSASSATVLNPYRALYSGEIFWDGEWHPFFAEFFIQDNGRLESPHWDTATSQGELDGEVRSDGTAELIIQPNGEQTVIVDAHVTGFTREVGDESAIVRDDNGQEIVRMTLITLSP
jgi:hypothetical protein